MSKNNVAVDLNKALELFRSVKETDSVSDVDYSMERAAALRAASRHLREVSTKNRQIAQDTRALGRDAALRFRIA